MRSLEESSLEAATAHAAVCSVRVRRTIKITRIRSTSTEAHRARRRVYRSVDEIDGSRTQTVDRN